MGSYFGFEFEFAWSGNSCYTFFLITIFFSFFEFNYVLEANEKSERLEDI